MATGSACWCALTVGRGGLDGATFQFVRHNDSNETLLCELDDEAEALAEIVAASALFGARLAADGDQVSVELEP